MTPNVINARLAKAIASVKAADKDSTNPMFKSPYSSIAAVLRVIKPALISNGLAPMQTTTYQDNGTLVTTSVIDMESGEEKKISDTLVPMVKLDAHAMGGATTYGRRYSWQSIFGLEADDNDGNDTLHEPKIQNRFEGTEQAAHADREFQKHARSAHEEEEDPFIAGKMADHFPKLSPARVEPRKAVTAPKGPESKIKHIDVKTGTSKKGDPYTKWSIMFTNGDKGDTFNEELGSLAADAHRKGIVCAYDIKPSDNPKWAGTVLDLTPIYSDNDEIPM